MVHAHRRHPTSTTKMDPAVAATPASGPSRLVRYFTLWVVACALVVGHQLLLGLRTANVLFVPPSSTVASPHALVGWRLAARKPPLRVASRRVVAPPSSPSAGALTVGVAVTVTDCGESFPLDGAIVLRYSILRQKSERYRYQFYAIYHPSASECVSPLVDAGYVLLERDTPVSVSSIQGEYLRRNIASSGCCGEKELIKFEALLLTQHPAVILLDMDMIVLKPLDDVIDLILDNDSATTAEIAHRHVDPASAGGASASASGDWWLLYVHLWRKAEPPYNVIPSQGGFAVLKPNRTMYAEIQRIVQVGDYHPKLGWGNATGTFYGAMTFQGLLPYYFQVLYPGSSLALDGCIHNHMHARPSKMIRRGNETVVHCFAPNCRSCLDTPFEDIYSVHFTAVVGKAWGCKKYGTASRHVQRSHGTWFRYRSELEKSWGRSGRGTSNATHPALLGYCSAYGREGYESIRQPYGVPV